MKIRIDPNYNLGKLQSFLTYELSGSVLFFLTYGYWLTLILALLAALVFLPFLIKVLIQEKKYGWFTFFLIFVAGSGLLSFYYFSQADWMMHTTIVYSAASVSLMFFYFYCGILKLVIPAWLHEEEVDFF